MDDLSDQYQRSDYSWHDKRKESAMKKSELWNAYCKRNPSFADDEATLSVTGKGVRTLFEQTYEMAYKQGKADAPTETVDPLGGMDGFGDLFRPRA